MNLHLLKVCDLIRLLGEGTPTPGGGSVAALCGSLAASLCAMVARVTAARRKYRDAWQDVEAAIALADGLSQRFLMLAQEDAEAYEEVMAALRLPGDGHDLELARRAELQRALRKATDTPMEALRASEELIGISKQAVESGNPSALTDAAAAVELARTAAWIASYNARVNLSQIDDAALVDTMRGEISRRLERIDTMFRDAMENVNSRLR